MAETMQFFNPKKIEVEVQKLDGTLAHLECAKITGTMVQAVTKAAHDAERDPAGAICEQMAAFFGGKKDEYREYDNRVLNQVIKWMTDQIRNPT